MRAIHLALAITALVATARGQTLIGTRPGLICTSPAALAALTLPDGSSRAASPAARPGDQALVQQGGCVDLPPGARLQATSVRKRTSVVLFDPGDGRGRRTFVVPNIDVVATGAGQTACLPYETPLRLSGRITVGKAYGEDARGKVGWSHWWQITLDHPICTRAGAEDDPPEHGVRDLQPVWPGDGHWPVKPSDRVTVEGKLFHADNGNQMTVVLIGVDTLVSAH